LANIHARSPEKRLDVLLALDADEFFTKRLVVARAQSPKTHTP